MRQSPVYFAFGVLLAVAGLCATGCTAIGYFVGAEIDKGNADLTVTRVNSIEKVSPGMHCRVMTIDSTAIKGECLGAQPTRRYQDPGRYEGWKAADSSRSGMPSLGDSLEIVPASAGLQVIRGRLVAVSTDSIWVRRTSGSSTSRQGVSLLSIGAVTSTGSGTIHSQRIRELASSADFPSPMGLSLRGSDSDVLIPADSIAFVDVMKPPPSGGRTLFTWLGVLGDAFIVAAAISMASWSTSWGQ